MGEETKLSGTQKLFTGMFSPATAARMEADSRMWMVQCPNCGYERSIWELGGIRYKAAGNPRRLMRCPNCGQIRWHKIYRREGPAPEVPVVPPIAPESGRHPRWLAWVVLLAIVAAFAVILFIAIAAILGFTFYVLTG
jgi:predicted RNA-binding Zn-ribbon protein involved in translation (DUF1610 family)